MKLSVVHNYRIAIIIAILVFGQMAISLSLYKIQIEDRDNYIAIAESQHHRIVKIPPERGIIYDKNRYALAQNDELSTVAVVIKEVDDPEIYAQKLSAILGISKDKISRIITQKNRHTVYIKRKISQKEEDRISIERENLPGIELIPEPSRVYPQGKLCSNVLGFVGMDNRGIEGLELRLEKILKGQPDSYVFPSTCWDFDRTFTDYTQFLNNKGKNVYLTIDSTIQYFAEEALDKVCREKEAKNGQIVIINPYTSEVIAMASWPTYDPNEYGKYDQSSYRNRTVTDVSEPGSTIKPFTIAAALEEGVTTPDEVIFCENGAFYYLRGFCIHDDNHKFGDLTVREVLAKSSNIGTTKLAMRLGKEKVVDYFCRFGLDGTTGIECTGEVPCRVPKVNQWSGTTIAAVPYGHEMIVTMIGLVSAYTVFTNGGKYIPPSIIRGMENPLDGEIILTAPREIRQVISPETAREVLDMMVDSTIIGTCDKACIPGIKVAGKTGTSRIIDPETGRYMRKKVVASFVGIAPADKPEFIMGISVTEPQGRLISGGHVAAPVFSELGEKILKYKGILQELRPVEDIEPVQVAETDIVMPDLTGKTMAEVYSVWSEMPFFLEIEGTGKVCKQAPLAGNIILDSSQCRIWFEESSPLADSGVEENSFVVAESNK